MVRYFLNISNHNLTPDQLVELSRLGFDVKELPADLKARWAQCDPSTYRELVKDIAQYMEDNGISAAHLAGYALAVVAMVMSHPEMDFYAAHSVRESVEETLPDGSVVKKNVFKHQGFYQYGI